MAETKLVPISDIRANTGQIAGVKANPRCIKNEKYDKLITSLLSLPKMLEIRPIVIDANGIALGGNMRLRALQEISKMRPAQINMRLNKISGYAQKSEQERHALRDYWAEWLKNPQVPVADASSLTIDEQNEFIIKDNSGFGEWDWDMLANEWDEDLLDDWGIDFPHDDGVPLAEEEDAKEDDFDEEEEVIVCRCKKGDIWQCGNHRIMCGDSTQETDVQTLTGGGYD